MTWVGIDGAAHSIALVVAFVAVAVWESVRPLRPLMATGRRWSHNAALYLTSVLFYSLIVRVSPVIVAVAVRSSPYGLLNHAVIPYFVRVAIAFVALDLNYYLSHRLFHAVNILWRVHRVHHSDRDFDVSTAARFHPLEVAIRQLLFLGGIAVLAPPVAAVFAYGLVVLVENLFVHANQSLPPAVEATLSRIFTTPDLHRIHHSEAPEDQNLNYGEVFSWWDRVFGTYAGASTRNAATIATGVAELRSADTITIRSMLTAPFRRSPQLPPTQT